MTSLWDYNVDFSVASGTYPVLWGVSNPWNPPTYGPASVTSLATKESYNSAFKMPDMLVADLSFFQPLNKLSTGTLHTFMHTHPIHYPLACIIMRNIQQCGRSHTKNAYT